jgi:hypothetical protein
MKADKRCEKAIEYWNHAIELDASKKYLTDEILNCKK